jgi:hypothetical protein
MQPMAKWKLVTKHEYEFLSAFPDYVQRLGCLAVGLAMTAGGAALLLYGTGGKNSFSAWIFGGLLLLFGLLAAGSMVLLWPWKRVRWARVYEEGLKWQAGRREYKYRWDEVTSVNRAEMEFVGPEGRRSTSSRVAYVSLRFADGTGVSFDPALTNYDKLANYVQQAVAASQLAESGGELDEAGKTFGPVHISRKGVTANGRFFKWKEVRWLAVHNGELCAHHECTSWRPIPLHEIPDYVLLLSLVKGLRHLRE